MESLEVALFEDPFYLYVGLALAAVMLAALWRTRRQAKWLVGVLVLAALAGGVYLLERAVVTDREQIWLALDDIAGSIGRHDIDHAAGYLDDNYMGWGGLRAAAVVAAKAAVSLYDVHEVGFLGKPEVVVAGKRADCKVRTVVHYARDDMTGRYVIAWQVEWARRPQGWRIRRAATTDEVIP